MNFLELVKNRYSSCVPFLLWQANKFERVASDQRSSGRAYKALDVEQEKLDYILECVRFAPSAVIIPLGYAADEPKEKGGNRTVDNRVGGHQRKDINEIVK